MKYKNYTEKMKNSLLQFDSDEESSVEDVLKFLNNADSFRSFGEGLSDFIQEVMPSEAKENPEHFLLQCCSKNGLKINRNTVANWFRNGKRPKKGEESREHIFIIAFALELTSKQTNDLFHNVYLDRGFNYRRKKEFIYYYCLKTGQSYQHAQELLRELGQENRIPTDNDQTIVTKLIVADLEQLTGDAQILQYIREHPHNFEINNHAAKEKLENLLAKAQKAAQEECERFGNDTARENVESKNFLFRIITGQSFSQDIHNTNKGTISLAGKYQLIKEISTNFPQPQTLSKAEMSYDELRKMIILLAAYSYWTKSDNKAYTFNEFESYLAELLHDINFPPLYYGNPYDWLFLYCGIERDISPLDTFRDILAEALNDEEPC